MLPVDRFSLAKKSKKATENDKYLSFYYVQKYKFIYELNVKDTKRVSV